MGGGGVGWRGVAAIVPVAEGLILAERVDKLVELVGDVGGA